MLNREISYFDIKGFKNIKAGFIYFDTQSGAKNKWSTFWGRFIIKFTTRSNIEHIAVVIKVPPEFVGVEYEDEYNGKCILEKGYIVIETTKHYNGTLTNLLKRVDRPSFNDIDKKGDSVWSGNMFLQPILSEYIANERISLALQKALDLVNQKPWINGSPSKYILPRAELSPFSFAKWVNKFIGYKRTTPVVFCSVFAKYIADIITGMLENPEKFDMLDGLGTNPKDISHNYLAKQLTEDPILLATFVDGKPITANDKFIISNPIYR